MPSIAKKALHVRVKSFLYIMVSDKRTFIVFGIYVNVF